MKKSAFALLGLLTCLSLILAACAPAATPTAEVIVQTSPPEVIVQTQVVESTVVVAATSPPELVTGEIRFASWDSGDALEPLQNAITSFEAAYPEATVKLESVPQAYGDKLLTEFAAGTAPDVFQVGDGDVAKFAAQGVLEPLDSYIGGENPLDTGIFFPGVFQLGQVEGTTYLLTKDYSPLVLYFNKDHFQEAGVEFPTEDWAWEDMLAAAQALTVPGERWGLQVPNSWGDNLWPRGIAPIIYQNGGSFISEDGSAVTGYLNSQETVEAIQWYVDLFLVHEVAPTNADVAALAGQDLFQTGRASMLWTGRWPLKDFQRNAELNFGTSALPAGKERANALCWAGFAMYANGENKDTAWAFLKWLGAEQGAQELAKYAFTPVQPIAELQGLDTDPFNAPIVKDLENVRPLAESLNPRFLECVEPAFKEELERVFLEGKDVQTAMDDAAATADGCLAEA